MSHYTFYNFTSLMKEYMILNLFFEDYNITQREISKRVGVALSMVNKYLNMLESQKYIEKQVLKNKMIYKITDLGIRRKKFLNLDYLEETLELYKSAKSSVINLLTIIVSNGYSEIVLYGAGEVCKILTDVINDESSLLLSVSRIIDDDENIVGKTLNDLIIDDFESLYLPKGVCVLISSYKHYANMRSKLLDKGIIDNEIFSIF